MRKKDLQIIHSKLHEVRHDVEFQFRIQLDYLKRRIEDIERRERQKQTKAPTRIDAGRCYPKWAAQPVGTVVELFDGSAATVSRPEGKYLVRKDADGVLTVLTENDVNPYCKEILA